MRRIITPLLSLLLTSSVYAQQSDNWAVLVAGSMGMWNYRHQADVCAAYHLMRKNGIPEDHIIVMAVDDLVHDEENPFPGQLYNEPSGPDVYAGCNIDYRGADLVTPDTFHAVLRGNASAVKGGRVLNSTKSSNVFLYFSDHGEQGFLVFPEHQPLFADALNETFTYMHEQKMYQKMVLYIEACHSASLFDEILSRDIGIYAVVAANSTQSSWGTYCYPYDIVNGQHMLQCLGDLFSVSWMQTTRNITDNHVYTLDHQFQQLVTLVTKSQVLRFGDLSIASMPAMSFLGTFNPEKHDHRFKTAYGESMFQQHEDLKVKALHELEDRIAALVPDQFLLRSAQDQKDAKLNYLYSQFMEKHRGEDAQVDFANEVTRRMKIDNIFVKIADKLGIQGDTVVPRNFRCLKSLIDTYEYACGKLQDYDLQYTSIFVEACEKTAAPEEIEEMSRKIKKVCFAF